MGERTDRERESEGGPEDGKRGGERDMAWRGAVKRKGKAGKRKGREK